MEQKSALERLYEESGALNNPAPQYSVDDLLNIDDEDNSFLNNMSSEGKETLFSKIEQVSLDDEIKEVEPNSSTDQLDNIFGREEVKEEREEEVQEVKRGRGRPRKDENLQANKEDEDEKEPVKISSLDKFMDSLAKDLIQELRDKKYETRNFNREQMLVILDYLEKKI